MYLKRLSELYLPRFEIGVFLLLDILPDKANELCLPVFEIRVVLLLRHCLSAAPSLSGATLLYILEGVPLSATWGRGWLP